MRFSKWRIPVVEFIAQAIQPYIELAIRRAENLPDIPSMCPSLPDRKACPQRPMPDTVTPEVRSRMMAGIRGKNTRPEMLLRQSQLVRCKAPAPHPRGVSSLYYENEITGMMRQGMFLARRLP